MRSSVRGRSLRFLAALALVAAATPPTALPTAAASPLVLKLGTIENLRSLNPYQAAYFPTTRRSS